MDKYEEFVKMHNDRMQRLDKIHNEVNMLTEKSDKLIYLADNCSLIISGREQRFDKDMELDSTDMTFLGVAIALQCVRQYVLSNDKFRFSSDSKAHKFFEKFVSSDLLGPVPYDAFKKVEGFSVNTGLSGANHRAKALGHDPLWGWIFGVMNILTETVTVNDWLLTSYNTKLIGNEYYISSHTDITKVCATALGRITNDPKALVNAVQRHALHLGTDVFTKMGLPVIVINNIDPNLSLYLAKNGIDTYSIIRGQIASALINMIISAVHSLFCDAKNEEDALIYSAKTKKIIMMANGIASTSNILYVSIKKDLTKLDVGGICNTLKLIVSDYKKICELKEEYVCRGFDKLVMEV